MQVALPYVHDGVSVRRVSEQLMRFTLEGGIDILWDGLHFIEITLGHEYSGEVRPGSSHKHFRFKHFRFEHEQHRHLWFPHQVAGLCGNFNLDAQDDLTTSEGDVIHDAVEFALSWKTNAACTSNAVTDSIGACAQSAEYMAYAKQLCSKLREGGKDFCSLS